MGRLVLYMSMSLDGFIAGPGATKANPFGAKGHRLHERLGDGGEDPSGFRPGDEPSRTVADELMSTGAVVTGRRTGDFVGYWGGNHHDGVPIFVPTHRIDDGDVPPGCAQFVTDVEDCAGQARAAAGDRAVMVHGARRGAGAAAGRASRRDGDPSRAGPARRRATPVRLARPRPHRTRIGPAAAGAGRDASPIPGTSPPPVTRLDSPRGSGRGTTAQ